MKQKGKNSARTLNQTGYRLALLGLSVTALSLVVSHRAADQASLFPTLRPALRAEGPSVTRPLRSVPVAGREMPNQQRFVQSYGKLPFSFEINRGQTDAQVKFLTRGRGYALFLKGDEAVLSLARGQEPGFRRQESGSAGLIPQPAGFPTFGRLFGRPDAERPDLAQKQYLIPEPKAPAVLHMKLVGANAQAKVAGLQELPGKVNYFIGNDPRKWRTNVATFAKVEYQNVYRGVDLVYYGNQGQLEYDFVVAPGSDPNAIILAVDAGLYRPGHDGGVKPPLQIAADGDFVIQVDGGEVRFHKPIVYQPCASSEPLVPSSGSSNPRSTIQNQKYLNGHYVLTADNLVHFEVSGYDKSLPLVIDPVLSYSTYLGSSAGASSIAVDASGSVYMTGTTASPNFPTMNPIQAKCSGALCEDAFIAKLNAAGNALVYSTYLGGSASDRAYGIAVDSSGNAYVMGGTTSTDFPTMNPFQAANHGGPQGSDAFVTKLNAAGSALVYSTYLGGSGDECTPGFDEVTGASNQGAIAVDSLGNAYVAGYTGSTDFPTANPLQAANGGGFDAFVVKFNATGSGLAYSTYLGGSSNETASDIAVDSSGNAYVTGTTYSTNFPTAAPFQAAIKGTSNTAFVTKLNAAGNALVYSTYLGGSSGDSGIGIALDSTGSTYLTGSTGSTDFPTVNAFQASDPVSACCAAFVTKFNAAGSALVYSTYLGGSFDEAQGNRITVDSSGNAYVAGQTLSANFPILNPIQGVVHISGCCVGFVTEFNPAGSGLVYSTFLGGGGSSSNVTEPAGIAVDASGNAYVTGLTTSNDFPTLNPFQATCVNVGTGCNTNVFISKISPANAAAASLAPAAVNFPDQFVKTTSSPQTVTLWDVGSAPLTISNISITGANSGDFALTGNTCGTGVAGGSSCTLMVTFTPTLVAVETANITVTDNTSGSPHTATLTGKGVNPPVVTLSPTSLDFGQQLVGTTSATKTVTITNTGGSPLTGIAIGITGAPGAPVTTDFSGFETCSGSPLAVGASCTESVSFTPLAAGPRADRVFINDNAPDSPQYIPLSGTGIVDFGVAVASGSSSTATVTAGQSASYTLSVTPQQAAVNQTVTLSCTGAPTAATCIPSPTSVTLNGATSQNITVTVATTARGMLPPRGIPQDLRGNPIQQLVLACVVMLAIVFSLARTMRTRPQTTFALLVLFTISLASLAACGGGSSSPPPPTGTPAGAYVLTIQGTSGSLSHKTTVTLNVN